MQWKCDQLLWLPNKSGLSVTFFENLCLQFCMDDCANHISFLHLHPPAQSDRQNATRFVFAADLIENHNISQIWSPFYKVTQNFRQGCTCTCTDIWTSPNVDHVARTGTWNLTCHEVGPYSLYIGKCCTRFWKWHIIFTNYCSCLEILWLPRNKNGHVWIKNFIGNAENYGH